MPATIEVLANDPIKFLKTFPIKIGSVGASRYVERVSYGQKRQMFGASPVLYFFNGPTQFDNPAQVETCPAHIVQALHGAPQFYTLDDQADVMLTSELSGCCVVLEPTNPPKIAHVWPEKGEDGGAIQRELQATHKGCRFYGKNDYTREYAYVIGIRRGSWRFYAQERPGAGAIWRALEVLT